MKPQQRNRCEFDSIIFRDGKSQTSEKESIIHDKTLFLKVMLPHPVPNCIHVNAVCFCGDFTVRSKLIETKDEQYLLNVSTVPYRTLST